MKTPNQITIALSVDEYRKLLSIVHRAALCADMCADSTHTVNPLTYQAHVNTCREALEMYAALSPALNS